LWDFYAALGKREQRNSTSEAVREGLRRDVAKQASPADGSRLTVESYDAEVPGDVAPPSDEHSSRAWMPT
jgi:Arc/MetJ-type ribon-helix-helix transcriptional regulator